MAHVPVLLREALDLLALAPGQTVVDATVGSGGFAEAALGRILPGGMLFALDRDPEMIARARERLSRFGEAVRFHEGSFQNLSTYLRTAGIDGADAIMMDLGISSDQLDDPARGLSFSREGPLDMRLDRSEGPRAWDLLQRASEEDLATTLRSYGEEPRAGRIARAIVRSRESGNLRDSTTGFASLVARAAGYPRGRTHPATRTFQALRIAVNDELSPPSLCLGLAGAIRSLLPGGRLAAISFHSLEDRAAKSSFREAAARGEAGILTKKPVRPSRAAILENPRCRSAKLRAVRRVEAAP